MTEPRRAPSLNAIAKYRAVTPEAPRTAGLVPEADLRVAMERSLRAYVSAKDVPRGRWKVQREDLALADAVALAVQLAPEFVEVGVLIATPAGGLIYWTSLCPIFNSDALTGASPLLER